MTASFDPSQALRQVRSRIDAAARASGRVSGDVALLAVSKLQPEEKLRALFAAGQRSFGENYVQEALDKMSAFAAMATITPPQGDIEWHLIGPLQSNKTRVVAEHFQWVHSVDRLKIAERLSAQRPAQLPPLNICVQVNISAEASKSGCSPDQAIALICAASSLPQLCVRGFMGMPAPGVGEAATRAQFMRLADLLSLAKSRLAGLDTLSMGMSDDLELAVACGSTMVRVGTALFGVRAPV